MQNSTHDKLLIFLNLVFPKKFSHFAEAIGVSASTVTRWLSGTEIGSDKLTAMIELGLNVSWLLDPKQQNILNMFADNAAGRALREKHFGGAAMPQDVPSHEPMGFTSPVPPQQGSHQVTAAPTPADAKAEAMAIARKRAQRKGGSRKSKE